MNLAAPSSTVLYSIEKAIKAYRKFSQSNINEVISDITIDQCLILVILDKDITSSQKQIAEMIFKDYASITRMIELMVKSGYLIRSVNQSDRRKSDLNLTKKGEKSLQLLKPKIKENRKNALSGLSHSEISMLNKLLLKIINNCKK